MSRSLPFALGAIVLASAAIVALLGASYAADVLSYAVVLAIFALAVGLTFGQLGYVSFGHAAFLGIGAYTVGVLVTAGGMDYWRVLPLALVPGAALGALVGLASVRLGGAYFAIATLTLAEMLRLIAVNWMDVTRGPLGLMVPVPALAWAETLGWTGQQGYLFVLLLVLGVALVVLARLRRGPLGRRWAFVREAPALAESVGIPTVRSRVVNIALSGALASLAGGLLVPKVMVLSPDLFGAHYSAAGLLAVILGGKATLIGPVLGGLAFGVLPEMLRAIDEYRLGLFALLLLVVVRVLPDGVVSLLPFPRRRAVAGDPPALAPLSGTARVVDAAAPGETVLEACELGRRFGGLVAVDGVGARVARGELLGIIGPNGAGKTTLLSMLSGFLAPSSGQVRLAGRSIAGRAPHQVARQGLVRTFQQTAHCASLTVFENVFFATHLRHPERPWAGVVATRAYRAREDERQALAARCLETVGLRARADVVAGTLPYGEQKLLGVAIALAAEPHILLLDEPAAGLNHTEGMRLAEVLRRLRAQGCTIAIIDHNLPLMMSLCDRLLVLQQGRRIADAAPAEIARHPDVLRAYLGVATPAQTAAAGPREPAPCPAAPTPPSCGAQTSAQRPRAGVAHLRFSLEGLDVRYGPVTAADQVALSVEAGEVVALIGANGAGKSSILKAIMGLTPHAVQAMTIAGRDIARLDTRQRLLAGISLSPEGRHVFAQLSVRENLDLGYPGGDPAQRARRRDAMYARFPRLRERERQAAGTLSGGEQQMLAIARALMAGPRLLMLDEPTLGLAPIIVQELAQAIREFAGSGIAVLLAEQNADMALSVADRGYVLQSGRAVLEDAAGPLRASEDVRKAFMGM